MPDRATLARVATRAALQARRSLSIPRDSPVISFDVAEDLGYEVRFIDAPSLEGMFSRAPHPLILLPSTAHRPRGRLAFTCAHELGHGILGHGERVDELVAAPLAKNDPEEFAANVFAGALLMPRAAVTAAISRRNVQLELAPPADIWKLACDLGVGYTTFVSHVSFGLELVSPEWAKQMRRSVPKQIRKELLGEAFASTQLLLDEHHKQGAVDLDVGDLLATTTELPLAENRLDLLLTPVTLTAESLHIYRALTPGIARLSCAGRDLDVRVSRAGYCGPQRNRFLDDPEAQ